jgi:hypothetical protein
MTTQTADVDMVVTLVKTPMTIRPTTALLPARLTVSQAVAEIRKLPATEEHAMRVVRALEREMAGGTVDYLVLSPNGQVGRIAPSTRLEEIAVDKEIRTPHGLERRSVASFEVQAYAKVGGVSGDRLVRSRP